MRSLLALFLPLLAFPKLVLLKLFLVLKVLFPMGSKLFLAGTPALSPFSAAGRNLLQEASVNLTSAQILALDGTPVTIVPAPGVGFRIVPIAIVMRLIGGSAAYTDAGGAVGFTVGGSAANLGSNAVFLVTVSPNRRVQTFAWPGDTDTAGNPPNDDNAPLQITKATNNFAAGNGTMRVSVLYVAEATT